MNWAENIKKLRNKMLLIQRELAKLLNVTYVSIIRWENGVYELTMKAKRALIKLFKKMESWKSSYYGW